MLLIVVIFTLCGCSGVTLLNKRATIDKTYTSALPQDIVFAVFPFNNYLPQIEFAASIQNILLQTGLNVTEPPRGQKEIEERKGIGFEQSGGLKDISSASIKSAEAQAVIIEKYTISEDIKADYYVHTMRSNLDGTIRIIRKSDRKVIGVITVWADDAGRNLIPYLEKINFIKKINNDKKLK